MLAFQIDPGDAQLGPYIELRIINALHQIVYRENRRLELQGDGRGPVEVLWRFVCPLGAGLYRCSVALGLVKLADVYEFTVVQPPRSPWSGLVDLRPTVTVIERPDANANGLAGSVTPTTATLTGGPASVVLLRAAIRNEGTREWRPDGITRVVVSYRLFNDETVCIVEDGLRTMLPNRMGPGEAGEIEMRIRAPAAPGRYVIALGFVRERVAWFGNASFVILQVAVPPVSSDRSVRSRRKGKTAAVKLAKVA